MKKYSILSFTAAFALLTVACTPKAEIDALVEDGAEKDVIVKLLDVNQLTVLDTVRTDAEGKFVYKRKIEKGQPEFIYLYYGEKKIASLLLEEGDKVEVVTDTAGIWSVSGSENCDKLYQVESDFADVANKFIVISDMMEGASEARTMELGKQLRQIYVDYYRHCVKYVLENSHSLTAIPVCTQVIADGLPVFGQVTDAITFSRVADSLETVYPDSKYVKAFRKEANSRMDYLSLTTRLSSAEPVSYFDIELPDINAQKRKLSDVDAKVVMIHFWTASQPEQSRMNVDALAQIYNDYHSRGFEIYQVALDIDKAGWAAVVKEQNLPWINVCDSKGSASEYVGKYNINVLPVSFFLAKGELVDAKVSDEKSLRQLLDKLLK